jgi:hypothetical protein
MNDRDEGASEAPPHRRTAHPGSVGFVGASKPPFEPHRVEIP